MLKKFEDILAQCIEDIKAGRCSLEDCLAKYPSISKQLEPLLRIALEIREPPDVKPSPAFKVRARVQLMEQIHAMRGVTKWPWFRYTGQVKPIPYKRRFNMVAIIVAVVLAISALGGGTAYASQGSLPGDVLYPVKLGTEQARLVLAANDVDKAELYLTFATSRVEEMTALVERGRPEKVDIAVNGYDKAMAMATQKMEAASGKGLGIADISESVGEATSNHLSTLDEVYERVPDEAKPAIERAREVSMNGQENTLRALARENPVRATEINLMLIERQLNRVRVRVEEHETMRLQEALQEFERLTNLGEEISDIAQGLGQDITALEELVALATSIHLTALDEVMDIVPEEAQEAIARAREVSMSRHGNALRALARENPVRAIQINLMLMEGHLNGIRVMAEKPEPLRLQERLQERIREYERLNNLGQEISQIARGLGKGTPVDQLVGQAIAYHLTLLAEVHQQVQGQAQLQQAIETAMQACVKNYETVVTELKERNMLGQLPEEPPIPAELPDEVKEKLLKPKVPAKRQP